MRLSFCCATVLTCLLASVGTARTTATSEEQIAQLVDRWVAARNANDAAQMRSLFDERMDTVRMTTGDVIARDAAEAVRWFETSFKGDGRGTTVRISRRNIRELSAEAAVADFAFTHRADQSVALHTTVAFSCVNRAGQWTVGALRFASMPPPA